MEGIATWLFALICIGIFANWLIKTQFTDETEDDE